MKRKNKITKKRFNLSNNFFGKIDKKLLYNLLIILASYLIFFAFSSQVFISNVNIFSILFIFVIYSLLKRIKFNFRDKKHLIFLLLISVFLSLMYNIGYYICLDVYNIEFKVLEEISSFNNFKCILGFTIFIFIVIYLIYELIFNNDLKLKSDGNFNWKIFLIVAFLFIILWIPYLLKYYPGIYTSDAIDQLWQATGKKGLINHHPILDTLYLRLLYNLFSLFTDSSIKIILFITLTNMIICALSYSYVISFLKRKGINNFILVFAFLYYALCPVIALYSVTIWKDVIFGQLIVLLCIQLFKIQYEECNIKEWIILWVLLLLASLFRNNAIYMLIFIFIVAFFVVKQNKKMLLFMFGSAIVVYYLITGPIFNSLGIKSGSISESLGIPLQQIARVVVTDGKINKEEYNYISSILPIDEFYTSYNPQVVDSIKFNEKYNSSIIADDLTLFLKYWFSIGIKNIGCYVESYLYSTIGYWYPNINGTYLFTESYENEYFESENLLNESLNNVIDENELSSNILFSFSRSIGFLIFVLLVVTIISLMKFGKEVLLPLLPLWGLWLTIMIATPVYCDMRYVFYIYTSLPFFVSIPFIIKKIRKF